MSPAPLKPTEPPLLASCTESMVSVSPSGSLSLASRSAGLTTKLASSSKEKNPSCVVTGASLSRCTVIVVVATVDGRSPSSARNSIIRSVVSGLFELLEYEIARIAAWKSAGLAGPVKVSVAAPAAVRPVVISVGAVDSVTDGGRVPTVKTSSICPLVSVTTSESIVALSTSINVPSAVTMAVGRSFSTYVKA